MKTLIPLLACFLIAFSVGSNSTSNAVGICIGCQIVNLKKALLYFGFFVFLGIFLQGKEVMETVGNHLVKLDFEGISLSLFISATLIIVSNFKKLPLSTHQVIIGSLTGTGLASGLRIDWSVLLEITFSWLISPFGAFIFAIALYWLMEKTISRMGFLQIERLIRWLLIISSLFVAYNTGANELATVLGPAIHANLTTKMQGVILGSLAVFTGAVILGPRVIDTVGKGITPLDPYSGFAAQFGASLCVLLFTFLGMPVSTTYCIIGGISGVGALKGMKTVKYRLLQRLILSWILAPLLAFFISYLLFSFKKAFL